MSVVPLANIDASRLVIKPPKQYDDSYICKIKYLGDKLVIDFGKVDMIQAKSGSLMFKVSRDKMKKVLELQDQIVEYAKGSVHKWFDRKIQSHVVEDMFIGSVSVDQKYGKVLKLRVTSTIDQEIVKSSGSLVMRLESIRFQRTSFNTLWDFQQFKPDSDYMFEDDSSSESAQETESEEEEVPEVDEEEILQAVRNDLKAKLEAKCGAVHEMFMALATQVETANLNEIEELSARIENIFSNNNIIL